MKKSIFLFFAAILCAMTANAETYYYSGGKSNWNKTEMTASSDGYYSYYGPVSGDHQFKIGTSGDQWAYNHSYVSKGFNNTDITDIGDWGSDNCYTWTSATHYILVYYPNTTINSDSKVKICASTVLPNDAVAPEPEPTELTYNVTVPEGTNTCYIVGAMNSWTFTEMTKTDDTHYTITIEGAKKTHGYKYTSGADWGYVEKDANGNELGNRTYVDGNDVVAKWAAVFDPDAVEQELTYSVTVPEGTYACYIAMDTDPAQEGWEFNEMTKVDDTHYTFVRTGLKSKTYKYACGEGWEYVEKTAENGEVADRTWAENDVVAKWATVYNPTAPTYDYYIAGTLAGGWSATQQGMIEDAGLYKATFTALPAGEYEFKVTNGKWSNEEGGFECATLGAAYEEVTVDGNIKIVTGEAKDITVIFNTTTNKITFEGLTEKVIAPVTVYFINSGNWDEVACYYWGGIEPSTWPGVQMDLTAETYEAEGWNVYKVTFPGDNTSCIFNNNNNGQQTGDLTVENGKYYCYANGIWYERLADVDPLDTRVYLKGDMNEWCATEGWCDMFRKEDVNETVAYRTTWLDANTTYEFKIEDAGTWLSNEGTMDKENCTGWLFEEGLNNAKITTEYAGDYIFIWDMTTKTLSVEYPNPLANPEVMDLMVTDMVFDGNKTFSGTDNMMGVEFTLVLGEDLGDGVYSLDASSTVNFGGTLFTDVTGMIAPDTETYASASATVYGFYVGMYFQLNVEMSAGGAAGVPVEILDGTATVNGAGELWITGQWEGDDVYVQAPGFPGESFECDEVWFYVGGTDWETASIIAFGPATITVDGNDVLVEGTVMSGMTGTNYELFVIGTLPAAAPETYTRIVNPGYYGTICLPYGSEDMTGATFFETSHIEGDKVYFNEVTTLVAGHAYIFLASASEIAVVSDGTEVATPEVVNGLHGTFTDIADVANVSLETEYIIVYNSTTSQCELSPCGMNCSLEANRAYVVLSEIGTEPVQLMPGCRRIGMSVQGENEATGFENITAPEGQAVKAIVNGQLIIIRNGEKFNAQGVRF